MKVWFLAAALLLVSAPTQAGVPTDTGFVSEVCQGFSPADVLDNGFPFDFANNVKECKKLCGVQANMCSRVAAAQAACEAALLAGEGDADKIDCNDDQEPGACKNGVKQSAKIFAGSVKTDLQGQKDGCKDYKTQCEAGCEQV